MQKYADYIKQIEIDALWSGRGAHHLGSRPAGQHSQRSQRCGQVDHSQQSGQSSQPKTLNYTYGNDHSSLDLLNKIGLLLL
jgi:hypothetical protein